MHQTQPVTGRFMARLNNQRIVQASQVVVRTGHDPKLGARDPRLSQQDLGDDLSPQSLSLWLAYRPMAAN